MPHSCIQLEAVWSQAAKSENRTFSYVPHTRHEPEKTVLYEVVSNQWQTFLADAERNSESFGIPKYIKKEFEAYLKCGILQYGFLRVRCDSCGEGRVVAFSCKKRGFCPSCGGRRMSETAAKLSDFVIPHVAVRQWVLSLPIPMRYWLSSNPKLVTSSLEIIMRLISRYYEKRARDEGIPCGNTGAVTFVQRFGSALNMNVHFHILFLDGVFHKTNDTEEIVFHTLNAPSDSEIRRLVETLANRLTRHLVRKGYIDKDRNPIGEAIDPLRNQSPLLADCVAASVQNKTALNDRAGQRVRRFGLHPLEARITGYRSGSIDGFSLHAGVSVKAHERSQLEHLIRYVARPAVALERLQWRSDGKLSYRLKRTFSDGTTHVIFSPLELIEKLVALVPRPRVHLVRYHGVLAPHARARSQVVPKVRKSAEAPEAKSPPSEKRISWARLLKRVFEIDVSVCFKCGGSVKIVSAILGRSVIVRILGHLKLPTDPPIIKAARAPPQLDLGFADLPDGF